MTAEEDEIPSVKAFRDAELRADVDWAVNRIYVSERRRAASRGLPSQDAQCAALSSLRSVVARHQGIYFVPGDEGAAVEVTPEDINLVLTEQFGKDWGKPRHV